MTLAGKYAFRSTPRVVRSGDGAAWIKAGRQEHLGTAEFDLDPHHRNQALLRGLGHDRALLQEAEAALEGEEWERLDALLQQAVATAPNPKAQERAQEARRYLKANWEGLGDWRKRPGPQPAGAKQLGTMESQVRHIAAARMKRRGASWSTVGANNTMQLRLLSHTGEFHNWLDRRGARRSEAMVRRDGRHERSRVIERLQTADPTEWLRVGILLLQAKAVRSPLDRALNGLAGLRTSA